MLDSKKLLYILPDVAYVAELLPTKKEHSFAIQTFRQINGEFIDDNELIADKVAKLISKIEAETYHLILPDFLFTNTIVEVDGTTESKIKNHLKEVLLPDLGLTKDSHQFKTFTLTQHKDKTKVQLAALEKSLLEPLRKPFADQKITISGISPLSWTIKSIVSLEPSITVIQIGTMLYAAQQYIGVDQAIIAPVSDVEIIAETIKTLKGAEPSNQTVYLLTNELVEEKLKELLSDTLPLQQLTSGGEEIKDLPSYVKYCIESAMKTLDIKDFPVPVFELGAIGDGVTESTVDAQTISANSPVENSDTSSVAELSVVTPPTPVVIPKPNIEMLSVFDDEDESETNIVDDEIEEDDDDIDDVSVELPKPTAPSSEAVAEKVTDEAEPKVEVAKEEAPEPSEQTIPEKEPDTANKPASTETSPEDNSTEVELETAASSEATEPKTEVTTAPTTDSSTPDLSQFAHHSVASNVISAPTFTDKEENKSDAATIEKSDTISTSDSNKDEVTTMTTPFSSSPNTSTSDTTRPVIKNQSSVAPMLKMVFITLGAFALTVAVGVGIGLGVLKLSSSETTPEQTSPVVQEQTAAEPSPIPSPSPIPELDKSKTQLLVVNATTVAGKAGVIKTALVTADFVAANIQTGNAKGEYETGVFVLLKSDNPALVDALAAATGLDLSTSTTVTINTEDSAGKYDAVIVYADSAAEASTASTKPETSPEPAE